MQCIQETIHTESKSEQKSSRLPQPKINERKLELMNSEDSLKWFGDWTNNLDELADKFAFAEPFEHVIIPNFLNLDYVEEIYEQYPTDIENWHKYFNPIEIKYANDTLETMPKPIQDLFYTLSTNQMLNIFNHISGSDDLDYDPYLHGSGIHAHPRYGRLGMHLDYEKHPVTGKGRRLNIILYLTKDWSEEWNGHTQLWDKNMEKCVVKSPVCFNTAIVFKTNEISWHGLPDKILCPEGMLRKTFAYYYMGSLKSNATDEKIGNDGTGYRTKATFVKRPEDPNLSEMEELYNIRPKRRITSEDMERIWPEWTPELF